MVLMEISRLFCRECQKSVTLMASRKLSRLQVLGRDRMPLMLLVISEGCLKAITMVMYSGNTMVD